MSNNFISKGQRNVCVTFVKYYPVLMQVIMLASIFDEFYPFSITNWLHPILGHSLSWDLFLLAFSRMFRFCIWHRLLIYSMIFNICVEWVTVNIEMPIEHNIVVWSVMAVTLLIIIASIVLRFKTGFSLSRCKRFMIQMELNKKTRTCFENERNSDRDAA